MRAGGRDSRPNLDVRTHRRPTQRKELVLSMFEPGRHMGGATAAASIRPHHLAELLACTTAHHVQTLPAVRGYGWAHKRCRFKSLVFASMLPVARRGGAKSQQVEVSAKRDEGQSGRPPNGELARADSTKLHPRPTRRSATSSSARRRPCFSAANGCEHSVGIPLAGLPLTFGPRVAVCALSFVERCVHRSPLAEASASLYQALRLLATRL